jgi:hypothetical protein
MCFRNHLVKERFLNPVDGENMEIHHKKLNGIRWDNRPANLQIIPHALNVAYAHGRPIIARCVRGDGGVVTHVSVAECARIFHIDRVNAAER